MFDKKIIIKHLSGNTSKQEEETFVKWLQEKEAHRKWYAEMKKIWIESGEYPDPSFMDPNEAFQKFRKKIMDSEIETENKQSAIIRLPAWARIAATAAVILAFSLAGYLYGIREQPPVTAASLYNEIIVPYGGISSVILPDSSTVWLHSGSRLKYARSFGIMERSVELEGEAYFDVIEDSDRPFRVNTSVLDVKVHGTRFNLKAYPDDQVVEATLEEGSIEITRIHGSKLQKPLFLEPKEKLTLVKESKNVSVVIPEVNTPHDQAVSIPESTDPQLTRAVITPDVVVEESTSWKDGVYILNQKKLPELVKILERRYKVKITMDESLTAYSYSGVLKDLTLEQVMNALKITSGINYIIDERNVYLYSN